MSENTISLEELDAMWPEVKYMCQVCGREGATSFDPASVTVSVALNFFPCDCGAEGRKVEISAYSSEVPNG